MLTVHGVIGFTDGGRLIILPESRGTCFYPRKLWWLADKRCRKCKWANFSSGEEVVALQGICHNPETRLSIELNILVENQFAQPYAQYGEWKEEAL